MYHAAHGAIEDGLKVGGRRMLTTLLQTFVEKTLEMLKTLLRAQFFKKTATSAGFLKKELATLDCVGADETIVDLAWMLLIC